MCETCESKAKQNTPFKRSLFTLLSHTQSNTELTYCKAKEIELSHTLSSSLHKIKNLATISLLCVMISDCISINSPPREELSNYLKDVPTPKLLPIFHRYINITRVLYFLCIPSGAGFPVCLSWLHTTHYSNTHVP